MMTNRWWLLGFIMALVLLALGAWQPANQAALVVRFDDTRVQTYCVTFSEAEITGYDLLERAGLLIEAQEVGMGASVCRLDDVGCGAGNCFCQCQGGSCEYWSYWQMREGAWQYAVGGASISAVTHGEIQGWSWGPGSVTEAIAPPSFTFEEVCAAEGQGEASTVEVATASVQAIETEDEPMAAVSREAPQRDGENVEAIGEDGREGGLPGSYVAFGLLLLVLGGLAVVAMRRRAE